MGDNKNHTTNVKKERCEKCGALLPLEDLYDLFAYTKKNYTKTDNNKNKKLLCFSCCAKSINTDGR